MSQYFTDVCTKNFYTKYKPFNNIYSKTNVHIEPLDFKP